MKKNISILLFLLLFNRQYYAMHSPKVLEECEDSLSKASESDNQIASPYISLFRKLVLSSAQREKEEKKEVLDIEKGVQANPKDSRDSLRSVTHSILVFYLKTILKLRKLIKRKRK